MQTKTKKRLLTLFAPLALTFAIGGLMTQGQKQVMAETNAETPILWGISDAVKPNETVTLTGYNLYADDLLVAYAPWDGNDPGIFDEGAAPSGCRFFEKEELSAIDEENGAGLSLILPQSLACGKYDFWVRANGEWSNGLTLNSVRPLYINQEASYAGLPIEIVGRNFFASEYGVETDNGDIANITVKLVRVADLNGNAVSNSDNYVVSAQDGVRYTTEESVTGEEIAKSNPYKITFETPAVTNYGTYEIYVSTDGVDYRGLEEPQQLVIYEKKAQAWNETVFGAIAGNTHVGNDPLGLHSYWAQDLNYSNVKTMSQNTVYTASTLATTIQTYTNQLESTGGVLYFPEGSYYLTGTTAFADNVIWVGAGADKTKIYYHTTGEGGGSWLKADDVSNIGFARMTFTQTQTTIDNGVYPDIVLGLNDTNNTISGTSVMDASLQQSKNKFVSDVVFDFPMDVNTSQRRVCGFGGAKNFVCQNVEYTGGAYGMTCSVYQYANVRNAQFSCDASNTTMNVHSDYTFLENVSFEKQNHGHGISLRSNASISNCLVKNIGTADENVNVGEPLVFEPAAGYFQTGDIASATARTFTVNMHGGSVIDATTSNLRSGNFAVQIVGGKGAGQMRYFKRVPTATNTYEFLDREEDWDVIPDSTSHYTIIVPMHHATVYRFNAENCTKGIYLYSQLYDAVVAECKLVNTEGILLYSVSNPKAGRINSDSQVRIVNNYVEGVSSGTNKGGINIRLDTPYRSDANGGATYKGYGTYIQDVTVRGNTVVDATPSESFTGKTQSEQSNRCGIVVDYSGGYYATVNVSSDVGFITLENNTVETSQYGTYYEMASVGAVIRNNTYLATTTVQSVEAGRISGGYVIEGNDYDRLDSVSLSLNGKIGVNTYVHFLEETVSAGNATVAIQIDGGETQEYDLAEGVVASDGCYKYTAWLDAKNIDTTVKVLLTIDGVLVEEKQISMRTYLEQAKILYGADTEIYDMLCATETYMDAASAYFAGETVGVINGLTEEIAEYAHTSSGELPTGVSNVQASLFLQEGTTLRITFQAESLSGVTCTVDGKRVAVRSLANGTYCMEIENISADQLGTVYAVKIGDYTLNFSALSYANIVLNNSGDSNLVNLMKALYLYNQAAVAYFA